MKRKKKEQLAFFDAAAATGPAPVVGAKNHEVVSHGLTPQAERLLANFEVLAEAPGGVKKLREVVLELAVTGKLVHTGAMSPVDCDHDTISNHSAGDAFNDGLPQIPKLWKWAQFIDVASIESRLVDPLQFPNKPHIAPDNIEKGTGRLLPFRTIAEDKVISNKHHFFAGQILYSKIRPNLSKVVIVDFDGLCSADMYPIATTMERRYLHIFMLSQVFLRQVVSEDNRVAMPKVNQQQLSAVAVPVPPLPEQKRIVAKVDELMKLCDELEARQAKERETGARLTKAALDALANAEGPEELAESFRRVVGNFDGLVSRMEDVKKVREVVLSLAVRGKLVRQDPRDENARVRIDRAIEKRTDVRGTRGARKKSTGDSTGLREREDLPLSWCVEQLANLVDPRNTISYGVLVPGNDVADGVPFVRAQDLYTSNHPPRPSKTISPDIEKSYARTRLAGGEILLCVVGSIGKLGIVPASWAGANIARAVARIKPIPELERDYLLLVLREESVQTYFKSTTRTLAQPTLNVGLIEQTPIPLPPLPEQKRIVEKVDQLMALCDELETKLRQAEETSRKVADALVSELMA
ncbi:MAG: restriction endonuclease subunit S [Polyangiaceae bacterium]|nr:restriction endonuclease subunit S [Polyangiaceae bacterium]